MTTHQTPLFQYGVLNGNGRIYTREVVEAALAKLPLGQVVLREHVEGFMTDEDGKVIDPQAPVVGHVDSFASSEIELSGVAHIPESVLERLKRGEVAVRTAGFGAFDADGKTIIDYEMTGTFLTDNPA